MKVTLVVASGPHKDKQIPVVKQEFMIGRDPQCQLRPASQAISKQHCSLIVRNDSVFLKDFGSTNGTFLNDTQLESNSERELKNGDLVRVGPLDFTVQIAVTRTSDTTPLPETLAKQDSKTIKKVQDAVGATTQPKQPAVPIGAPKPTGSDSSDDDMAAMLLGMDADGGIPEGSTVFEMTALNADGTPKKDEKAAIDPKKAMTPETSSQAASDILRKFMKRPR
jgi:predicted component of type VI protein secretion system